MRTRNKKEEKGKAARIPLPAPLSLCIFFLHVAQPGRMVMSIRRHSLRIPLAVVAVVLAPVCMLVLSRRRRELRVVVGRMVHVRVGVGGGRVEGLVLRRQSGRLRWGSWRCVNEALPRSFGALTCIAGLLGVGVLLLLLLLLLLMRMMTGWVVDLGRVWSSVRRRSKYGLIHAHFAANVFLVRAQLAVCPDGALRGRALVARLHHDGEHLDVADECGMAASQIVYAFPFLLFPTA